MSDQTAPPGAAPAPAPTQLPGMDAIDALDPNLKEAIAQAIQSCAESAAGAPTPAEQNQAADAALKLAQALVILDPQLVAPQGIPAMAMYPPKPEIQFDKSAPSAPRVGGP